MTGQLVRLDGILGVIAKAADRDIDAARELWRLTLFETLGDLTDTYASLLDRDLTQAVAKRAELTRVGLLRSYIDKRMSGQPVDDVLGAAAQLALIEVAKDYDPNEPRNARGEWARTAQRGVDAIATFTRKPADQDESDLKRFIKPSNGTDRRIYRQIGMVGNALAASSTLSGQPHVALLGHTAGLVGELGPQAEQILGPGLKRTAYRYRGTEKRPNRRLQVTSRALNLKLDRLAQTERSDPAAAAAMRKQLAAGNDLLAQVLSQRGSDRLSVDQLRLRVQSDLAGLQLADAIPDLDSAKLSLASGKLPPSRGIIIDADGDIVTEAQGVDGDHYLPFDLKNLRRMHGGAYVRTRATGGPTDEDIYTGLLTGARQVTVMSHSGVFTVEFDPDLRGGRRYSDKARAMVGRYSNLLSAVGSGQVYAQDLSPAEIAAEREKFLRTHPSLEGQARSEAWQQHLDRIRSQRQFAGGDLLDLSNDELLTEADRQATQEARGGGQDQAARRQAIYEDLLRKQREQTVRAYKLDGDGYKAALGSLRTEFPFFIRDVQVTPLPQWLSRRGVNTEGMKPYRSTDIGRTRRGGLEPMSVEAKREKAAKDKKDADDAAARGAAAASGIAAPAADSSQTGAATPSTTTSAPWIEEGTKPLKDAYASSSSDFARELGYNLKKALALTNSLDEYNVHAADADEANAASKPDYLAEWGKGQPNNTLAAWVVADPRRIDTAERVLKDLNGLQLTDDDKTLITSVQAQLAAARTATAGFTKADGDPILTVPEDSRPVDIPEITALGDRMGNYARYLEAHPEVAGAAKQLSSIDPDKRAEEVANAVSQYKELGRWHAEGLTPEARGRAPDDVDAARSVGELKTNSEQYKQLAALQKAFTLLAQQQALSAITGKQLPQDGEPADPKAVTKQWQPKPGPLRVHRPGSPLSVALAKRQASPSRRQPPAR